MSRLIDFGELKIQADSIAAIEALEADTRLSILISGWLHPLVLDFPDSQARQEALDGIYSETGARLLGALKSRYIRPGMMVKPDAKG